MSLRRRNSQFYPQQFRIFDLLALTTIVALAAAMAAPWLRGLDPTYRGRLLLATCFQIATVIAAIVYYARKRQGVLDKGGEWYGAGIRGAARWRYWPVLKAGLYGSFLVSAQLSIAIATVLEMSRWGSSHPLFSFLFYQFQLSFATGLVCSMYHWRIYPSTIEFFQHGIVQKGTMLIPWDQVELRPSSQWDDCLTIVMPMPSTLAPTSPARSTMTVQVTEEVRARLLGA